MGLQRGGHDSATFTLFSTAGSPAPHQPQEEAISLPSTTKLKQLLQFYGIRGEEREGRSYAGVEKL